jgi:hypothetical protein
VEDRDFFDVLYQGWSKTTGAENTFWMPEEYPKAPDDPPSPWIIYAVAEDQSKTYVGETDNEADAGWITALHGCFADLVRRLHMAVDLAEQKDVERDRAMGDLLDTMLQKEELRTTIEGLGLQVSDLEASLDTASARIKELEAELDDWEFGGD